MSGSKVVPIRATHLALPPGDAGIKLTIEAMTRDALGVEGAQNPQVRAWALAAVREAPDRDDYTQAALLYRSVKQNIQFRGEYSETVQTPLLTLQFRAGDCDDHATLMVALLRSIGIPARFTTVSTNEGKDFTHVYALAGIRRGGHIVAWVPLDTTVPQAYPGWKPPIITREKTWGSTATLGEGDTVPQPKPLGQRASDVIQVIDKAGATTASIISAFRNPDTGNLSVRPYAGGVQASGNVSPAMLAVGGIIAGGALAALIFRRR